MRFRNSSLPASPFWCRLVRQFRRRSPAPSVSNRKQQMLVSEAEVEKGAQVAYQQELDKARKQGALNADQATYKRVQAISRRLIPQTTVFRPDAAQWKWEVNVQTTDDVNAYCMPGGKIMVYTGLIDQLKATDAELAAVIGHEIAHALREHSRERLSRAYAQQLALTGIAIATGAGDGTMAARKPGRGGHVHSCRTVASRKPRPIGSASS